MASESYRGQFLMGFWNPISKLWNTETKGDRGPGDGQTSSVGDPSLETQSRTINVVLFGETGVGKSSVINLIARKKIAKVSSDVNGTTMQYNSYDISFDDKKFAIFDTVGLEEPQMGVNGYLKAIEKAYELISKLGTAGGIHLLLFCMRGGRITATTQSNYRLFCECLCSTRVPIALVFTGLEKEVQMEDWWNRNKKHIEGYGLKSDGHACITAVPDDTLEGEDKYMESQETIRELLKTCALKGEAFSLESHSWFARTLRGLKSFAPAKRSPKKKDIMNVLTRRCKLDLDTAKRIADMMEKGDEETSGSKDQQAEEGEGGRTKNLVNEVVSPSEHDNSKAAPGVNPEKAARAATKNTHMETSNNKTEEGEGGKESYAVDNLINDDSTHDKSGVPLGTHPGKGADVTEKGDTKKAWNKDPQGEGGIGVDKDGSDLQGINTVVGNNRPTSVNTSRSEHSKSKDGAGVVIDAGRKRGYEQHGKRHPTPEAREGQGAPSVGREWKSGRKESDRPPVVQWTPKVDRKH